jgi:GAF domain-containing protein
MSAQNIQRICPFSQGALYIINASQSFAEAVAKWGEPGRTLDVFEPLSCWAIRRGRQHLVDARHPGLRCEHITGPMSGQYLCVPLLVNGQAIGILHLNRIAAEEKQDAKSLLYTGHKIQLVQRSPNTLRACHIDLRL